MELVVDTNVLFSFFKSDSSTRKIIIGTSLTLYAPHETFTELIKYTEEICDKCGASMIMKKGRFGVFLACGNYPTCKNTKPVKKDELTERTCEKCGSSMILRRGRFGPFLACSGYPACKNIAPVTTGLKCPVQGCSGEIRQNRSKKGKAFYSCTIRDCKFICWTKPVDKKCPTCGAMFLIKKGKQLICPNPECEHKENE